MRERVSHLGIFVGKIWLRVKGDEWVICSMRSRVLVIKKKKKEERRERKMFKGTKQNPKPLFSCVWVWRKILALGKVFLDGFSSV